MSNNPYERVARPGVCGDLGHKLVDFQCEYCGLIRPVAMVSDLESHIILWWQGIVSWKVNDENYDYYEARRRRMMKNGYAS